MCMRGKEIGGLSVTKGHKNRRHLGIFSQIPLDLGSLSEKISKILDSVEEIGSLGDNFL